MKRTQKDLESIAEETIRLFDCQSEPLTGLSWIELEDRLNNESRIHYRPTYAWVIGISLMVFLNFGLLAKYHNSFVSETHKLSIEQLAIEYHLNQEISIFNQD